MYEIKTFLCCPEMTTLCCWGQRTSAKSKQPKKYLKKRALKRFPVNNQVPCSGTTGWPPISDFHQLTSRKLSPLEWMSSRLHQNCHPLQILMYTDMFPLSLLLSHSHFYTFTFPFSLPLFHFYISISLSYFHTFPLLLSLSYFHTKLFSCSNGDTDNAWKQDFLSKGRYTEEQQHQLRDIRRRGKNKVNFRLCFKAVKVKDTLRIEAPTEMQMVFACVPIIWWPIFDQLRLLLKTAERENWTSSMISR